MRVNFTFRNLESSEGIKNYATEKIAKLQKYVHVPLDAEVTLSLERHLQCADITVTADGKRFAGQEESEDMYVSIDKVMSKIDRQVRDAKAAMTDRKRHSSSTAEVAGGVPMAGEGE
jgi:putative sigma-54 modulation protein